ncbi:hypothetical protein BLX24_26930 [Arsenicibacter rosenii]|uniref:Laminin G domain-containing protein n=2 Tax=Arsenicibacter rosenii TaxID=1750698 RepID=A0A1S2VB58_9BACT|nr:hypothetical protein BLX24_26930 [Arsenicibacter rosenii]
MSGINSIYPLIQHLTRSNTAPANLMRLSVFILMLVSGPGSRIAVAQRQTIRPNEPATPRAADNTANLQTSSCAVTLTRIDVYGFGNDNYNGSYLVNGTINGAPSWKMDNQIIQWTGTEWQIFRNIGNTILATNKTGSASYIPCDGWSGSGSPYLTVGCGALSSPSVRVTPNAPTISAGQSVTLTATGTGTAYLWSNGETSTEVVVAPASTTTLSVTARTGDCVATATAAITVRAKGAALNFASGNYVATGVNGIAGNSARTVEAWIKTSATADSYIMDWGNTGTGGRWGFVMRNTGYLAVYLGGANVTGSFAVNDGKWHHVAVSTDPSASTAVAFYIDGVLKETKPLPASLTTLNTVGDEIYLGATKSMGSYFVGTMDEVRIWDRALADYEVALNYACQLNPATQTGLRAYYTFNQGDDGGANTGITSLTNLANAQSPGTLKNFSLSGSTSNWVAPGGVSSSATCTGTLSLTATPPASVVLGGTNCPGRTTFTGTGRWFAVTGPGNYLGIKGFRSPVINRLLGISDLRTAGTYYIVVYDTPGIPPYITSFQVTGSCP